MLLDWNALIGLMEMMMVMKRRETAAVLYDSMSITSPSHRMRIAMYSKFNRLQIEASFVLRTNTIPKYNTALSAFASSTMRMTAGDVGRRRENGLFQFVRSRNQKTTTQPLLHPTLFTLPIPLSLYSNRTAIESVNPRYRNPALRWKIRKRPSIPCVTTSCPR